MSQHPEVGTNAKDPVTMAYPGKVPGDVSVIEKDGVRTEISPASETRFPAIIDGRLSHLSKFVGVAPKNAPVDPVDRNSTVTRSLEDLAENQTSAPASDTLGGATSQDVHQGIGRPIQGESSAEYHHDGKSHRKNERQGTSQYGPQGEPISSLRDTSLRDGR